ncbi:LOG family protein [Photorhabdus antumapuensis]|uniref:LOG family protein n=1 Tax=Photorhabdus antumapuensis TaxID=2862867 RepID=UPI001CEC186B|nr:TIGR00730 family Rossman fold protein [Photorhabdus antumapuensis]MCA6220781.1 TIGR00730 family Rossman fold protein [Photorhabdus antumapuensis]
MRVGIFCGSSNGNDEIYTNYAKELVEVLYRKNIDIVYGGGHVGIMGTIADASINKGMNIIGVMPKKLVEHELAHTGLSEIKIVSDMHERKKIISDYADFFIALPGGTGTLEEIFEVWTWGQLGFHDKPCAILNVNGYYDSLIAFFREMVEKNFMKKEYLDMLVVSEDPNVLLELVLSYEPPRSKWN